MKTLAMLIALAMLLQVAALGGNNVFGIFRLRRNRLLEIQERREVSAASKGFAGPHGQPLSAEEAEELSAVGWLQSVTGWVRSQAARYNSKE